MASEILKNILDATPDYLRRFSNMSFDVVDQIDYILSKKGWTRSDLAREMKKDQAEVSKWMGRSHNLTLKSIARIEAALGEPILQTPLRHRVSQMNVGGTPEKEVSIYNNLRRGGQFVGATIQHTTIIEQPGRPEARTKARRVGSRPYFSSAKVVAEPGEPSKAFTHVNN